MSQSRDGNLEAPISADELALLRARLAEAENTIRIGGSGERDTTSASWPKWRCVRSNSACASPLRRRA